MKKTAITIAVAGLLLMTACAVTLAFMTRSTQGSLQVEQLSGGSARLMPLEGIPFAVRLSPELSMKFDTGADVSVLNPADAEKLRQMGIAVTEKFGPCAGRDGYGNYVFGMTRYTVDLPVGAYELQADSAGRPTLVYTGKPTAIVRNVDFIKDPDGVSTLGLDFLRHFKLECLHGCRALNLIDSVPAAYTRVIDIEHNIHLTDPLWSPVRCYMKVWVNQRPDRYMLDTGLQRTAVKKPSSHRRYAKHELRPDTVRTMLEESQAYVDTEAWVDFGVRSGTNRVFYYDNSEEDFQINPLNVFQQDMLFDIEGAGIYFRRSAV